MYLEIVNEGKLEKNEEDKIHRLLEENYNRRTESSGSMGIANVNQRLEILYGTPCGLEIEQAGEDYICSRLTILVEKDD